MSRERTIQGLVLASMLSLSVLPLVGQAEPPPAGEQIVGEVCSGCHGQGLLGAPKIGDNTAWQGRLSKAGSVKALVETAEHGKGNMPPRGGESTLSDSELQGAIQYMLGKSGVSF